MKNGKKRVTNGKGKAKTKKDAKIVPARSQKNVRTALMQKEMIAALKKTKGIVTQAAKMVGISRDNHANWLRVDAEYRHAIDNIWEERIDYHEYQLDKQSAEGNSRSTTYFLDAHGQKRGYGLKPGDGTGSGVESKHFVNERLALSKHMVIGLVIDRIAAKQNIPAEHFWWRLFNSWYAQNSGFATSKKADLTKLALPSEHVFDLDQIKEKHRKVEKIDKAKLAEFKRDAENAKNLDSATAPKPAEDAKELTAKEKLAAIIARSKKK